MTTTIKPGDPAWVHDHNIRPGNWRTDTVKSVGPKWITLTKRGERFEVAAYDRGVHRNAPNLIGVTGALFSEQAYLDYRFADENRLKLAERVRKCIDANTLRAIAALLDKDAP